VRGLFKKTWFHRAVYFTLLLAWSYMLWPRLSCPSCISSLGVSYGLLFYPVATLLLVQVIFDTWITWLVFLLFSVAFSVLLTLDEYFWRVDNQSKVGWTRFDIISDLALYSTICLAFVAVIFLIRPARRKMTVSEVQQA
jgi:hypothetical protein